jgi:hypothetical protein
MKLIVATELRNRVYSYAYDNNSGRCLETWGGDYTSSMTCSEWDDAQRELSDLLEDDTNELSFLHLTQVCRQIRAEFRPIYLSGKVSAMRLADHRLRPYLDAFYPGWNDQDEERGHFIGNILIVEIENDDGDDEWLWTGVCLTPFFEFLAAAPAMHITFQDTSTCEVQQFIELFRLKRQWAKYIDAIDDISLNRQSKLLGNDVLPEFHLLFKHDYELSWVDYGQGGNDEIIIDTDAADRFMDTLGFIERDMGAAFAFYVGAQSRIGDRKTWRWIHGESPWARPRPRAVCGNTTEEAG